MSNNFKFWSVYENFNNDLFFYIDFFNPLPLKILNLSVLCALKMT